MVDLLPITPICVPSFDHKTPEDEAQSSGTDGQL
jgi:hypothetical protein